MEGERKSNLFPNRRRPKNDGIDHIAKFTDKLSDEAERNNPAVVSVVQPNITKTTPLKYPNKSHKGKAGKKAEYDDPRLKKDYNVKISLSTKVRIERLISRFFDGKSVGELIDLALNCLVLNLDRDERDSLYKIYIEDMTLLISVIEEKNKRLSEMGKPYIDITDEINQRTLEEQKRLWVNKDINS